MAASAAYDMYPRVEIRLSQTHGKSFLVHPYADQYDGYQSEESEFVMTTDLDFIPSGATEVFIKPLCDPCNTPFRLVGFAVSGRHIPLHSLNPPINPAPPVVQETQKTKKPMLLWDKPEPIVDMNDRKDVDEIRYASFGTSITWGSGLDDRDNECYVWRLTENDHERGVNYAIRSGGPNYPASCVGSMLKDEEYDVFILEFFMRAEEGLQTLLTRLRDRFPN